MFFLGIEGRPGVSWGVLGCPGVIRLTELKVLSGIWCYLRVSSRVPDVLGLLGFNPVNPHYFTKDNCMCLRLILEQLSIHNSQFSNLNRDLTSLTEILEMATR